MWMDLHSHLRASRHSCSFIMLRVGIRDPLGRKLATHTGFPHSASHRNGIKKTWGARGSSKESERQSGDSCSSCPSRSFYQLPHLPKDGLHGLRMLRESAGVNTRVHAAHSWEQEALYVLHAALRCWKPFLGDNLQKNKKVYKLLYETVKWFLRGGLYNWIIRTKEIWGAGRGLKAQHAWPHLV